MSTYRHSRRLQCMAVQAALIAGLVGHPDVVQSSVGEDDVATLAARQLRSRSATIAGIILHASELSGTFGHMVDIINASNAIVYVEEGRCGGNVRACLVSVTPAGPHRRILHVRVDVRKPDADLVGSIGHELYHATEVLDYPAVTTDLAMHSLYRRIGFPIPGGAFETNGAIEAGAAVRDEMRAARSQLPTTNRLTTNDHDYPPTSCGVRRCQSVACSYA